MSALADLLAARTLELVNIPSESRSEAEIAAHVRSLVPPSFELEYESDDAFVWARPRSAGRPLVVLAGHYDTVPAQENIPGRIENDTVDRAWRERHEGRPGGDARARAGARPRRDRAGGRRRSARIRQGGAAGRVQPAARPLRSLPARARGRAGDPARADRQHDSGRLSRQPERADRLPRRQRALRAGPGRPRTPSTRRSRASAPTPRSSPGRSRSAVSPSRRSRASPRSKAESRAT